MIFTIKNIADVSSVEIIWKKVVEGTTYAWFWSEYYDHCYRITILKAKGVFVDDKSFFIYDEKEELCGLVPLVFIKSSDFNGLEASYDKPLPWPMIMKHMQNNTLIINFIFKKIDELLREGNVVRIRLEYSPPDCRNYFSEIFSTAMKSYKYIDNSFMSHYVSISNSTLDGVRKRYKRDIRKYSNSYLLSIINKNNVDLHLIKEYMNLHVKDSGKIHRPLKTYIAQFDYIVKGDGFIVQVKNKGTGCIVGMLMICISKKSAYDGSVVVDPDYQQYSISHLMKWKAIQYLLDINVKHYELGMASESNNYLRQPSKKNYGISFFKNGWSRGSRKKIVIYEKYFSRESLNEVFNKKISNLISYFEI